MAYSSGTYSTVDNLLTFLRTFLLANGWTAVAYASEGTGNRLHMYRSIDGTNRYINMRSCTAEAIFTNSARTFTGIGLNMGTGYAASPTEWDSQAGTTGQTGYGSVVNEINIASGKYHFFAQNGGDQIVAYIETGDATGAAGNQFRQLAFGTTTLGVPFFGASGGSRINPSGSLYDDLMAQRQFMFTELLGDAGDASKDTFCLYEGGTWTTGENSHTVGDNNSVYRPCELYSQGYSENTDYSPYRVGHFPWHNSPDPASNNPILTPTHLCHKDASGTVTYAGDIDGLVIVNSHQQYADEDIISLGGEDYMLTHIFPAAYAVNPASGVFTRYAAVACKK